MIERWEVERVEQWRDWAEKIPALKFNPDWEVKISPPFAGAIARFIVNGKISVYLDAHCVLGFYLDNAPYWEIYPVDGDTYRVGIDDTTELMEVIQGALDAA